MPADGVATPEFLTQGVEVVRVCGAGLGAAQPPGMILPADGVAAPEFLTRGVEVIRVCGAGLAAAQFMGVIAG